mgnify:CR=1 FL=1
MRFIFSLGYLDFHREIPQEWTRVLYCESEYQPARWVFDFRQLEIPSARLSRESEHEPALWESSFQNYIYSIGIDLPNKESISFDICREAAIVRLLPRGLFSPHNFDILVSVCLSVCLSVCTHKWNSQNLDKFFWNLAHFKFKLKKNRKKKFFVAKTFLWV